MSPRSVPGCAGVHLVDTRLFDVPGAMSAYVVDAERPTVVDTGAAPAVEPVLEALDGLGVAPADVAYLIPTHVHLDHAGAAGALARECPNATVLVHERGRDYLVDDDKLAELVESARRALGETAAQYGEPEVVPAERCAALADGERVDLGDRHLTAIDAPGHAPHQCCLLDSRDGALFAGDAAGMALAGDLYPTTPPPNFDLEASLATLDRLVDAGPEVVCYGHFGTCTDADAALRAYRELLPEWVEAVAGAREEHGDREAVVEALAPEWSMPTLDRDVAGVLQYLEST